MTRCSPILALTLALAATARADNTLAQLRSQFRQYALSDATDRGDRLLDDAVVLTVPAAEALRHAAAQNADGSWPDIDYRANARSSWQPFAHVSRMLSLTLHARRPGTPPAESAQCLAALHKALAFWMKNDFQCPNWWYNQIGVPKLMADIALLLDTDLTPDERTFITGTILTRSKVGAMTGQNREWLAGNGLMRGLLLDDPQLTAQAADVIWSEVHQASDAGEGIQPDGSFHQHGPQQQFGNYGMAFAVEAARWATVLRDSPHALPPAKLEILRAYLLNGQNWVTFNGAMDISAVGRQLFPGSQRNKAAVIAAVMTAMTTVDPARAADYAAFVTRNTPGHFIPNDLTGARVFYDSDYAIFRTPTAMASVKMHSSRVIGGETVNSENLAGALLADGATFFYASGRDYLDIFPLWNWRQIPGTTELQSAAPPKWPAANASAKDPDFVGGASDGASAALAMDFRRDTLSAHKAWFFHDGLTFCLGAAIHSSSPDPVFTTIDQCRLFHPADNKNANTIPEAPATTITTTALRHNGLNYLFPEPTTVSVSVGPRTGNWKTVFDTPATPREEITGTLFTLWIDHGRSPAAATYAYAVVSSWDMHDPQFQILANTESLQAVRISDTFLAAIFWKPGSLPAAKNIPALSVDHPCIVMIDSAAKKLSLADPTHSLKEITLTGDLHPGPITLPTGPATGSTITLPLP